MSQQPQNETEETIAGVFTQIDALLDEHIGLVTEALGIEASIGALNAQLSPITVG